MFPILIAFIIALPNLFWQYEFNFPVVSHMTDLAATQLVNVNPFGFIISQLHAHAAGVLVWVAGLIWLLFSDRGKRFRFLGWGYVFLVLFLLLLSGKSYYAYGVYPILMAAGGVVMAMFFENKKMFGSIYLWLS